MSDKIGMQETRVRSNPSNKGLNMQQNRFWDMMYVLEAPLVIFIQYILLAEKFKRFWALGSKVASSSLLSMSPILVYATGYPEKAWWLAASLVGYAITSTLGKTLVIRRRPGTYSDIFCILTAQSSSFPSRHTIGATVLAAFIPGIYGKMYLCFTIINRIVTGHHFLSDCLAGMTIGLGTVYVASFIHSANVLCLLLVLGWRLWPKAWNVLAGCMPVIVAPKIEVSPYMIPVAFACPLIRYCYKKLRGLKGMDGVSIPLLASSLTVLLIVIGNEILEAVRKGRPAMDVLRRVI